MLLQAEAGFPTAPASPKRALTVAGRVASHVFPVHARKDAGACFAAQPGPRSQNATSESLTPDFSAGFFGLQRSANKTKEKPIPTILHPHKGGTGGAP